MSTEPRTELAPTQERCWESPESHEKKETDLVRCKAPAQHCQPHSREVWDLPVPLTLRFIPRDSGDTPAEAEALPQAQGGRIMRNSLGRPLCVAGCCLQPSPVSRLGESIAARSPFLLCCLPRKAALSPRAHSPRAPIRTVPWAQHPEGKWHPGTHRQLSQQAMSSVRM